MSIKKRLNKKGQSAVEFLILLPVLIFVSLVAFQIFSAIYTSLVNQAAARFQVFYDMKNHRGFARKLPLAEIQKPIYPELEIFSPRYRAENKGGVIRGGKTPPKPYFAAMVEEPRGSGSYPKRDIRTVGVKTISVKSRFGVCERDLGVCK